MRNHNDKEVLVQRKTCVPPDPGHCGSRGTTGFGSAILLERWPEWQSMFAHLMTSEFGAGDTVLDELRAKKAQENFPKEFRKST